MKEPTNDISESEISELIVAIRDAAGAGKGVVVSAVKRLHYCIDVGQMLASIKGKMKHGRWLKFCEEVTDQIEEFDVSIRTLQNWMRLHQQVQTGKIDVDHSTKGLRHAYQLAGIMPESDDTKSSKTDEAQPLYMIHLLRLNACIERLDIKTLGSEERQLLRQRLTPLQRLYASLA